MTDTTLTPSRLWKRMTVDQRTRAARAFWADPDATDDQVQAALLIAQQKKFRPKTVIALDLDRKARPLTAPSAAVQASCRTRPPARRRHSSASAVSAPWTFVLRSTSFHPAVRTAMAVFRRRASSTTTCVRC